MSKFLIVLLLFLFSCTKPAETEEQKATPESTGTTAGPSGSAVVTQVNSSTTDGAYKAGDVISVRVTFGLEATVTGTPRVLLETGNTDRYATYTSGSGGVTLVFSYTVLAGDESADLSYVNINSLELNGGTISGPSGAMNLVLPGLNASGSLSVNRALVIDTTVPAMTGSVTDGTYHNSLSESPTMTWAAGTDTGGSGIARYQVAIGTTSGGTQTLTWTDIGNVTTYQVTSGITLVDGTTYYPSIRAVDLAGNVSTAIVGDGWIVDATAPTSPATVYDGISTYNTTETPTITWTTSTDAGSGLAKYQIALGTTAGGTDILTWTDIGTVTSYVRTGLTLSAGTTYYASVRSVDNAGNMTTAQGDGWQVVTCDTYGWCPQAYIKAPNAEAGDALSRVVVSGDTLAVAAVGEGSNQTTITNGTTASSDNSVMFAGAVYVYQRSGNTWVSQAYIKPPVMDPMDLFGFVIDLDGDTLAVAATWEDSNQLTITNGTTASSDNSTASSGAVYVYKRTGSVWAQEAYIKAANGDSSDEFGNAVSIRGDTLAVGTIWEDSNQTTITNGTTASSNNSNSQSGAAYVFKRTGTTWAQEAYIKPSNSEAGDWFGSPLELSGDTLAVGAVAEDSNQTTITNGTAASSDNSLQTSGAVYVFKRTGVTWAQQAYIKAANADVNDQFGGELTLDGDTLAVSAANESSNQTTITNGTTVSSDNSAAGSGAIYVYKRTGSSWAQEAYIKTSNSEAADYLSKVSLYGDVLVVGASGEDSAQATVSNGTTASSDNSALGAGAVFVFKRTGSTWAQEAYLKAPNAKAGDSFGSFVSIYGDTIAVGTGGEDSNQTTITNGMTASSDSSASSSGAAYVYTVNRQATWQQQAYVKPPNAEAGDNFGVGVAVNGDVLVVGAMLEDSNQTTITNGTTASADNSAVNAGAAYVFKRTGTTWAQEAYLKAPNAETGDGFGQLVGISGDTIVIGAIYENSNQTTITNGTTASADNSASGAGAAYVFKRSGTTWAQEAYLKAPNAGALDNFGSVAINGDTIIVGATGEDSNQTTITNGTSASANNSFLQSGAAYVFKRTGTAWAQEAYLKAPNAGASDFFGESLAISGDTIVVGATSEDSNETTITNGTTASANNSASASGAAYVFKRTGTTWAQEAYLKATNAEAFDGFGKSVTVSGDTIAVGACNESSNQTTITNGTTASSDNSASEAGAVYIFKRAGTTWAQEAYIKSSNMDTEDHFGWSVSLDGNSLAVGANQEDSNQTTITNGTTSSTDNSTSNAGAAYVFKRTGSAWTQEAYLKPPNPDSSDFFGWDVSISGDTVVVGAFNEGSNQTTITNGTTASSDNSASSAGAVYIFQR